MSMNCEHCDGRLESYEGETYCPECTYYQAVASHDQATDEALAVLAQDSPELPAMDNDIPF
jgi:hypothetical protein